MVFTTAATAYPNTGPVGITITLSGYSESPIGAWWWNVGDGSPLESGQIVTHQYNSIGTFYPTVTTTPSGVYMDTFIIDNFTSGLYDPGWDDEFTALDVNTASGFVGIGDTNARLAPSGTSNFICGNFDFQFDFAIGEPGANRSEHLRVFDTSSIELADVELQSAQFQIDNVNQGIPVPLSTGDKYTTRLVRGVTLDSSGNASYGASGVIRWYYLDNWSGGATNEWIEFPDSPITTATGCVYTQWNGGTYDGIDNVIFQADSGLPYSSPQGSTEVTITAPGTQIDYISLRYINQDRSDYTTVIDRMKFTDCEYEG